MISLSNIRQFLLDKWWSSQWENNFLPPEDLGFGQWFSLFVPSFIDEKSDTLKDIASLLSSIYEIEKNNFIASVNQSKDILSIRINDADNHDGAIALDTFEYFIEYAKKYFYIPKNMWEKFEKMLNTCIKLWWKPWWGIYYWVSLRIRWISFHTDKKEKTGVIKWEHDLFSIDSWLMEFVAWKEWHYVLPIPLSHYVNMCQMTAEQKIQYFLDNALPTKKV